MEVEVDLLDNVEAQDDLVDNVEACDGQLEARLVDTCHGLLVVADTTLVRVVVRDDLVEEVDGLVVDKMAVDSCHVKDDNGRSVGDNDLKVDNGLAVDTDMVVDSTLGAADSGQAVVDKDHEVARAICGRPPGASLVDYYRIRQTLMCGLSCWGRQNQHHFFSSAVAVALDDLSGRKCSACQSSSRLPNRRRRSDYTLLQRATSTLWS